MADFTFFSTRSRTSLDLSLSLSLSVSNAHGFTVQSEIASVMSDSQSKQKTGEQNSSDYFFHS